MVRYCIAFCLLTACGSANDKQRQSTIAGAPAEARLVEPNLDRPILRPDRFRSVKPGEPLAVQGCDVPLEWSLGRLDKRFGLGRKQVIHAIITGANYWSTGGRRLFRYSPQSRFTINFTFDERQEMLIKRRGKRDPVAQVRRRRDALRKQRKRMLVRYRRRAQAYEAEVADWNSKGGAPAAELKRLRRQKQRLKHELGAANDLVHRINALGSDINTRGRGGVVHQGKIGNTHRRTRGRLTTHLRIDIYAFSSWYHLTVLMAHELGHALGLRHVANPTALMYTDVGPDTLRDPSVEDRRELRRRCGL